MQQLLLLSLLLALRLWREAEPRRAIHLLSYKVIQPKHLNVQKAQNSRFCD